MEKCCGELFYGLLFVSGESFWRGYVIFGLREKYGYSGVPIMIVPYVMSHYGKPFFETMGAIIAGGVLGCLALRHNNFWLGFFGSLAGCNHDGPLRTLLLRSQYRMAPLTSPLHGSLRSDTARSQGVVATKEM